VFRRSKKRLQAVVMLGVLSIAGIWVWRKTRRPISLAPPAPIVSVSPYADPPGIVIHASDSPAKVGKVAINAARLEEIHKKRGFGIEFEGKKYHIGYHYVILPDGTVEKGRPDYAEGSHAPTFNRWLGICLIGQFSSAHRRKWWPDRPTDAQLTSLLLLCQELMSKYHIPPALVKRHIDVNMTHCPGDRFPYSWLIERLTAYAATHPETNPTDGRSLVVERYIPPKVQEIWSKRQQRQQRKLDAVRKRRVAKKNSA
jgi:N-acetylmuramoyl-L-alanine amidase